MENNRHFGTLFGTRIVETKPPDTIEKKIFIWGPFKPEFSILEYCCASQYMERPQNV